MTNIDDWEKPRNDCAGFMMKHQAKLPICMSIESFHRAVNAGEFEIGPFRSQFGDGYGEPYNPWRQVFGKLKSGVFVFAELYTGGK